jgi:hypothetical protein
VIIYGISKHPYTKDYIIVFQYEFYEKISLEDYLTNQTSGNISIENLIQKIQLDNYNDLVFEWIPYNYFYSINKAGINLYSAIWKDGLLNYDITTNEFEMHPDRTIILKYLYDIQDVIVEVFISVITNLIILI